MKKDDIVNKIIDVTTNLIQNSSGNIDEITIRKIAEQADIGIGLINYHFGTKDQLIEQCVQRIISNVISSFLPDVNKELCPSDRLKTVAKQVLDFIMENPAISRISILGDHRSPKLQDNTMSTIKGFSISLQDSGLSQEKKQMLLFSFSAIIQAAFLRKDISRECFSVDFNRKAERDKYLDFIIDCLFSGSDEIDYKDNHMDKEVNNG